MPIEPERNCIDKNRKIGWAITAGCKNKHVLGDIMADDEEAVQPDE